MRTGTPTEPPLMWGSQRLGVLIPLIFLSCAAASASSASTIVVPTQPQHCFIYSPSSDQQHSPGGRFFIRTHHPAWELPPLRAAHVQLLNDRHRPPLCALPAARTNAVRETIGYTAGDLKSLRLLSFGDGERLAFDCYYLFYNYYIWYGGLERYSPSTTPLRSRFLSSLGRTLRV